MHLLEGCRESLRPDGEPERQIVFNLALTFLQMHRLHRREKEVSLESMRVDVFSDMEKEHVARQIDTILDGKGGELRLEITILDNLRSYELPGTTSNTTACPSRRRRPC